MDRQSNASPTVTEADFRALGMSLAALMTLAIIRKSFTGEQFTLAQLAKRSRLGVRRTRAGLSRLALHGYVAPVSEPMISPPVFALTPRGAGPVDDVRKSGSARGDWRDAVDCSLKAIGNFGAN